MEQNPLAAQVGGDHYKGLGIQPIEFATVNAYDPSAFSTLKYITRHATKHGLEDVKKGRHFVEIRARLIYDDIAPMPVGRDIISVATYCLTNRLGKCEAAVLGNLHLWVLGEVRLPPDVCANLILQQIDHLIHHIYPNERG